MSIPDRQSSEVHDFREILSHEVDGELPLLVGGHAVNLWAFVYREKIGSSLDQPRIRSWVSIFHRRGAEVAKERRALHVGR
jgi:hypothetical protein